MRHRTGWALVQIGVTDPADRPRPVAFAPSRTLVSGGEGLVRD